MNDETVSSAVDSVETDIGHASVIVADNKLILLNDTGQLMVGTVSDEGFQELTRATVLGGEIGWTAPSLIDGCVFARNQSKAVCVFLGNPGEVEDVGQPIGFANEIEQPTYVPLAEIILGTEPKYAMTAPRRDWLVNWFVTSIVLGWVIAPLVALVLQRALPLLSTRNWFLLIALLTGVFGTTVAGKWQAVFYFSWPIALFVFFEWLVCQLQSKDTKIKLSPIRARLSVILFVAGCYGYFWLCRRLSLAFEWTFLLGFPFTLPLLWQVKKRVQAGQAFSFWQWFYSAFAFTIFYWVGAGVILWKYPAS